MQFREIIDRAEREWRDIYDPSSVQDSDSGFIRDPVHGHIRLEPWDFLILDCPPIQRLRGIEQLSFVDRIYPGANHTRFEHTLGVAELVSRAMQSLREKQENPSSQRLVKISKDDVLTAKLAGYFHDVGHLPFSHALEPLFHKPLEAEYAKCGMTHGKHKPHELIGFQLIKSKYFRDLVRRVNKSCSSSVNVDLVADVAMGTNNVPVEKSYMKELIHGDLDCDRMDYLVRDAYYCGVPHGQVDPARVIETFILEKRKGGLHIGIVYSGLPSVEAMYFSRSTMYITVYLHHTSRIIEGMILRGVKALTAGKLPINMLFLHTDRSLLELMQVSSNKLARTYSQRLAYRRFFKRLFEIKLSEIPSLRDMKPGVPLPASVMRMWPVFDKVNAFFENLDDTITFEGQCAKKIYPSRVKSGNLLIDCPKLKLPDEPSEEEYFPVRLDNNTVRSILDVSPMVRATEHERKAYITSIIVAGIEPSRYKQAAKREVSERLKKQFGLEVQ